MITNPIHWTTAFLWVLCLLLLPSGATAKPDGTRTPHRGEVYLLRHALAPGSGDPPGMRLDDPSTQRNLNEAGRQQARAIGEALRAAGVQEPRVFTSEWARCRETAELLGFGPPEVAWGLNSFWERPETQPDLRKAFDALVASLPKDGPPVIFVTHYINIYEFTGRATGSGEGFWIALEALAPNPPAP